MGVAAKKIVNAPHARDESMESIRWRVKWRHITPVFNFNHIIAFAKEGDLHGLGHVWLYRKNTINWLFDFVEEEFMFIDLL